MGYLVQGQPEAEVVGLEGVAPFESDDIGSHVVDDVLVLGGLVLQNKEVVLAEHPCRHPPEDRPHLDGRRPGAERRQAAGSLVSPRPLEQRTEEPPQRG